MGKALAPHCVILHGDMLFVSHFGAMLVATCLGAKQDTK